MTQPVITFTLDQFNSLMRDLGEMPHRYSRNLIDALDKFASAQLAPVKPVEDTDNGQD